MDCVSVQANAAKLQGGAGGGIGQTQVRPLVESPRRAAHPTARGRDRRKPHSINILDELTYKYKNFTAYTLSKSNTIIYGGIYVPKQKMSK